MLQQLGAPGSSGSNSREKAKMNAFLQTYVDDEHAFDAVVAHREMVLMLAKYLSGVVDISSESKVTAFELYTFKHEWGISMAASLHRLNDLALIGNDEARRMWRHFRKAGWMETEPGKPLSREQPTAILRIAHQSWLDGRIEDALAATLLDLPVVALERLRDLDLDSGESQ